MKSPRTAALITSLCSAFASVAQAEVKLPPIISDHMVFQRDVSAPPTGRGARARLAGGLRETAQVIAKGFQSGCFRSGLKVPQSDRSVNRARGQPAVT